MVEHDSVRGEEHDVDHRWNISAELVVTEISDGSQQQSDLDHHAL